MRFVIPGWMLLFACGDSAAPAVDAALADADPAALDAAADALVDARAGDVTVIALRDDGQPEPGTVVLVHGADGALLGRYTTGPAGAVAVDAPPGGMVSAIQYGEDRAVTTTVVGVQPQDELRFPAPPQAPVSRTAVDVIVPLREGATSFDLISSCGGPVSGDDTFLRINAISACLDGLAQFALVAHDADDELVQTHRLVENASALVNFPDPFGPLGHVVLDVRGGQALRVRPVLPAGHDALLPLPTTVTGPRVTVPLAGAGNGLSMLVERSRGSIAQRLAATPTEPVVVDLSAIPRIDAPRIEAGSVSWFIHGTPVVDGLVLRVVAAGPTGPTWRFVLPPEVRALTPPVLPEELAHVSPLRTPGGAVAVVDSFELSWVSDWDTFRQGGHVDAMRVPAVVATTLDDSRAVVGQSD